MTYLASRDGTVSTCDGGGYLTRTNRGLPIGITSKGRQVLLLANKFWLEGFSPADMRFNSSQVHAVSLLELEGLLLRVRTVTGVRYWITDEGIEQAEKLSSGSI